VVSLHVRNRTRQYTISSTSLIDINKMRISTTLRTFKDSNGHNYYAGSKYSTLVYKTETTVYSTDYHLQKYSIPYNLYKVSLSLSIPPFLSRSLSFSRSLALSLSISLLFSLSLSPYFPLPLPLSLYLSLPLSLSFQSLETLVLIQILYGIKFYLF